MIRLFLYWFFKKHSLYIIYLIPTNLIILIANRISVNCIETKCKSRIYSLIYFLFYLSDFAFLFYTFFWFTRRFTTLFVLFIFLWILILAIPLLSFELILTFFTRLFVNFAMVLKSFWYRFFIFTSFIVFILSLCCYSYAY